MYYAVFSVADPGISNEGGGLEFLVSGVCFDAHSYIPYALVVRVENKVNIVKIV